MADEEDDNDSPSPPSSDTNGEADVSSPKNSTPPSSSTSGDTDVSSDQQTSTSNSEQPSASGAVDVSSDQQTSTSNSEQPSASGAVDVSSDQQTSTPPSSSPSGAANSEEPSTSEDVDKTSSDEEGTSGAESGAQSSRQHPPPSQQEPNPRRPRIYLIQPQEVDSPTISWTEITIRYDHEGSWRTQITVRRWMLVTGFHCDIVATARRFENIRFGEILRSLDDQIIGPVSELNPFLPLDAPPYDDGYDWVRFNHQDDTPDYLRARYLCAYLHCPVTRSVERSRRLHRVRILYQHRHRHLRPTQPPSPPPPPPPSRGILLQ